MIGNLLHLLHCDDYYLLQISYNTNSTYTIVFNIIYYMRSIYNALWYRQTRHYRLLAVRLILNYLTWPDQALMFDVPITVTTTHYTTTQAD